MGYSMRVRPLHSIDAPDAVANMIGVLGSFGGAAYEATFIALLAIEPSSGTCWARSKTSGLTACGDETILHYRGDEPSWVTLVVADYVRFCAGA